MDRIQRLLDVLPDGFFSLDREWRFTYINRQAARNSGYEPQALLGKNIWQTFPMLHGSDYEEHYRRAMAEQVGVTFEAAGLLRGAIYQVRVQGSPEGLAVMAADITELRRGQEQAQIVTREVQRQRGRVLAAEERLQLALDAGDIGTWEFDARTQALQWDARTKAMYGLPRDGKVSVETFFAVAHPDDRERLKKEVEDALAAGTSHDLRQEFRAIGLTDGVERWVSSNGRVMFDDRGQALRIIGCVRDITSQKRAEQAKAELYARAEAARLEAERANAKKDEFLSAASHELRTPLTTLQLVLEALLRHAGKGQPLDPVWTLERLQRVQKQLFRLERLVAELLDVSRIAAGRLSMELGSVDLADLVREVVERLGDQAQAAGSLIQVQAPRALTGNWDRFRLDQVVTNLVGNALKYGAQRPVHVTVEHEGDTAALRVRDEGIGIPPEDQGRIFERFERAGGPQSFGGFGVGLWIVRQIVEALGGRVTVRSEPGRGAEFEVRLPL